MGGGPVEHQEFDFGPISIQVVKFTRYFNLGLIVRQELRTGGNPRPWQASGLVQGWFVSLWLPEEASRSGFSMVLPLPVMRLVLFGDPILSN